MKKNNLLTVVMVVSGRKKETLRLLNSLRLQDSNFGQLVMVESVGAEKNFSKQLLSEILRDKNIVIEYRETKENNIALSRNLGLNLVKTEWALFLDNDVSLDRDFIKKMWKNIAFYPDACGVVGRILPDRPGYLSEYSAYVFSQGMTNLTEPRPIKFYSLMAAGINVRKVKGMKIYFDEKLPTGEDTDFFLKVIESGGKLIYFPDMIVRHKFENDWRKFIDRYYRYSKNELEVELRHPKTYTALGYYPKNIIEWLFWPVLAVSYVAYIKRSFPLRFLPATLVSHMVMLGGIYLSPLGRKRLFSGKTGE